MRSIRRCFNKQLQQICQQAIQLDELNVKLTHYLPIALRPHCSVGSFNKGCLMIIVTDAVWATELRYCIPELRDKLRKEAGLYQLLSVTVQIADSPDYCEAVKKTASTSLSDIARQTIQTASDLCHFKPLKNALSKLANNRIDSQ